jgi:small subunit ribosomal protein S15
MYLTAEKKQEIFGQYGKSKTDTGSAEAQIALFSFRINHLTGHLKSNKKDYRNLRPK